MCSLTQGDLRVQSCLLEASCASTPYILKRDRSRRNKMVGREEQFWLRHLFACCIWALFPSGRVP